MTEEEYKDYMSMLGDFNAIDEMIQIESPNPNFSNPKGFSFKSLLNYRIPLYQAMLGVLAAVLISGIFYSKKNLPSQTNENEEIIFANQPKVGTSLAEDDYPEMLVVKF